MPGIIHNARVKTADTVIFNTVGIPLNLTFHTKQTNQIGIETVRHAPNLTSIIQLEQLTSDFKYNSINKLAILFWGN